MKPVNNLSNIFYKKQFKATYNGFFHHGLIYRLYEHFNELYTLFNQLTTLIFPVIFSVLKYLTGAHNPHTSFVLHLFLSFTLRIFTKENFSTKSDES